MQKKNRHAFTARQRLVIDRESPAKGYRHVVTKRNVRDFTEILPQWDEVSELIECIFLSSGDDGHEGSYAHYEHERTGIINLAAWEEDLWCRVGPAFFEAHQLILDRLGVAYEELDDGWQCRFTLAQARAFTLLHVFMHELGHHVDRLRHKNKDRLTGGEEFAERYANDWFDRLWPDYVRLFGKPC